MSLSGMLESSLIGASTAAAAPLAILMIFLETPVQHQWQQRL